MRKLTFPQVNKKTWSNIFLAILLIVAGASSGYTFGYDKGRTVAPKGVENAEHTAIEDGSKVTKKTDFGLFWEAWNVLTDNYYGEIDDKKRVEGAISGMVSGLGDPYTVYMEPETSEIFKSDLSGNFGGIGAELTMKNGYITIVAAMEGTPADKAGLMAGDIITQVNGEKTGDISFNAAINKIRGEKGTDVTLTLVRQGVDKAFDVKITRDTIVVKSVKSDTLQDGKIAYIKVNQFGEDTLKLFKEQLELAKSSGKTGIVIDLRNNPGGLLNDAIEMIGMLIPNTVNNDQSELKKRTTVIERGRDGKETKHVATSSNITDLPITVLVNGGSASASEILAGALKDYGRAKIIGTKTFGKGSVQDLVPISNGGSVKVTIAKWFTPLGNGIDGKGIEPDENIELPADTKPSTTDVQMVKALEILASQIK